MSILNKEDYEEPTCLLNMDRDAPRPAFTVPIGRVIEKLDEYLSRDDWAGAGRHLNYWLAEAKAGGDKRGELAIQNERMGYFRKSGKEREAFEALEAALQLLDELGMRDNIIAGTTWVNAATVCKTFGHAEEALPYFSLARTLYERELAKDDKRLGGLYNNMALACADLARYDEAEELYHKALDTMRRIPGSELEQAVTLLNLADLQHMQDEEADVFPLLEEAEALLKTEDLPRDGYYAFVCRTCAPGFDYYGWFMTAKELREAAEKIYAGT